MSRNLKQESYSQLVARYKKLRMIIRDLQNGALTNYVSKKTLLVSGKKLGVLQNKTFVLDDIDQMGPIMDYCIYDYRQGGLNAVDRYMDNSQLDPDSEKYEVVKAMSQSFYTIVQVEDVLPNVGVIIDDLWTDRQYTLIDMGLGQTAKKGIIMATRLLPFDGFVTTSGAALPVNGETLEKIYQYAFDHSGTEDSAYTEIDIRQTVDLNAEIIRICLEANASDYIQYQDADDLPITSPIHRESRIGRNEPCSCGSGKKYKRCCEKK